MIINRGRSKFRIVIEPSKYYTCIGESIYSYEKQYMHLDEHSRVLFKTKDFDVGLISGSTIEDVSFEDLFLDMSSESEYSCEKIDVEGVLKRSPKPLIVVGGAGRSGTTLLLSILGSHSSVHAFDEELYCFYPNPPRIRKLINAIDDSGEKDKRWCEKTPKNVKIFGNLLHTFEKHVKLIHVIRDGRDVITSVHPAHTGRYWVSTERWIEDVEAGLEHDENVYRVKYEDIVLNTEKTLRSLCKFIEEPFEEEMMNYALKTSVANNIAWENAAQPIHSTNIGKWKSPEHAKVIEEFMNNEKAVSLLKKLGYKA